MMRNFKKIVVGFVVLLFVVVVGYFFSLELSKSDKTEEITLDNLTFVVTSEYENLDFITDNEVFSEVLKERGVYEKLTSIGVMDYSDDSVYVPKKITIVFTPEEQELFPLYSQSNSSKTLLRSFGGGWIDRGGGYRLNIYVGEKILGLENIEFRDSILSAYIIEGLYLISSSDYRSDEIAVGLSNIEGDIVSERVHFVEARKRSLLNNAGNLLVTDVNAQTCTGGARGCYANQTSLICSGDSSYDCSSNLERCPGGTCRWITECTGFAPKDCKETFIGTCDADPCNPAITCSPPDEVAPSCHWNVNPPPTATPGGPTATPGGPAPTDPPPQPSSSRFRSIVQVWEDVNGNGFRDNGEILSNKSGITIYAEVNGRNPAPFSYDPNSSSSIGKWFLLSTWEPWLGQKNISSNGYGCFGYPLYSQNSSARCRLGADMFVNDGQGIWLENSNKYAKISHSTGVVNMNSTAATLTIDLSAYPSWKPSYVRRLEGRVWSMKAGGVISGNFIVDRNSSHNAVGHPILFGIMPVPTPTAPPPPTLIPSPLPTTPPCSCVVRMTPASTSVNVGGNATFQANTFSPNCAIQQVNFFSSNASVARVSTPSDNSAPYSTSATGLSAGISSIRANVLTSDGLVRCVDSSSLTVNTPLPTVTPPPGCSCGPWNTLPVCGVLGCAPNQKHQSRICTPGNCSNTQRCVFDVSCLPPTATPNPTATPPPAVPSCTLNLIPSSLSITDRSSSAVVANVSNVRNGTIDEVRFVSSNSSVASVSPRSDSNPAYISTVSGQSVGTATVSAVGYMGGVARCSDSSSVDVAWAGPQQCTGPTWRNGSPIGLCTGSNYSSTWQWSAVWDSDAGSWASEYQLQVDNNSSFSSPYEDTGWRSAATFGCAFGGTCSYTTTNHNSGTRYYGRVRTRGLCTQSNWSSRDSLRMNCASCDINVSDVTVPAGSIIRSVVSIIEEVNGDIDRVDFTTGNSSIATVSSPDTSPSFRTAIEGISIGNTSYTALATMDNGVTQCSDTADIEVTNPPAWWQAGGGDVVSRGAISSRIPYRTCDLDPTCDPYLIVYDTDYPGVAVSEGSVGLGGGGASVSEDPPAGWVTEDVNIVSSSKYNYDYFRNKLALDPRPASELLSGTLSPVNGYSWFEHSGSTWRSPSSPFRIDSFPSDSKIVLFVDDDVEIRDDIVLDDGNDFFMVIASGDITIDSAAENIEGIFVAGGDIITESSGASSDTQLHVRGSLIAPSGTVVFQRELPNNAVESAEIVEYAPDLVLNIPLNMLSKKINWKEVAP